MAEISRRTVRVCVHVLLGKNKNKTQVVCMNLVAPVPNQFLVVDDNLRRWLPAKKKRTECQQWWFYHLCDKYSDHVNNMRKKSLVFGNTET